jgi:beta-mannosidase
MVAANINAVRVWGGGLYESEEFYDLADRNGNPYFYFFLSFFGFFSFIFWFLQAFWSGRTLCLPVLFIPLLIKSSSQMFAQRSSNRFPSLLILFLFTHIYVNIMRSQLYRLRHRPSILVWAGNNENELAIRDHWYPAVNYFTKEQIG